MQRIYGKNDTIEKEHYQARHVPPVSTERHPDLYRKSDAAMNHQQSAPVALKPSSSYTIPTSSHIVEKEPVVVATPPTSKPYFPAKNAYYQEPHSPQQPQYPTEYTSPRNLHCIVIADHIVDCPICSRFYRNYTPVYNVIILILVIVLIVFIIRSNNRPTYPTMATAATSVSKPAVTTTSSFL